MARINSTPSIAKQRIHASFVERNRTVVNRASSVEPVNPVNPVQNNIGYSSANHLMTSDLLYDKLEDLKRDYLDFYNHERNLHRTIEEMDLDEEIQLEIMINLLDKYNRAIISLGHFDQQLRTNNVGKIKEIILAYINHLNNLGIYLVEENQLGIDEEKYKDNLNVEKDVRKLLFKPVRHMFLLLYREFRNIKGPYKENFDDKYPEFPEGDSSGLVLDAKS